MNPADAAEERAREEQEQRRRLETMHGGGYSAEPPESNGPASQSPENGGKAGSPGEPGGEAEGNTPGETLQEPAPYTQAPDVKQQPPMDDEEHL